MPMWYSNTQSQQASVRKTTPTIYRATKATGNHSTLVT